MYTLDQLAHFDRCLFPGDFRDELVSAGMQYGDALLIMWWIMQQRDLGRPVGIVNVYQEYVCTCVDAGVEEHTRQVLNKVLSNFFAKF